MQDSFDVLEEKVKKAAELVKRAGGKVTGSVSGKTDYVVAGDSAGGKVAAAGGGMAGTLGALVTSNPVTVTF